MSEKFSIFISHDSSDESLALSLKSFIEKIFLNSDVFVSGRDLVGGEIWIKKIHNKLENSKIIISLITRSSINNLWVYF